MGYFINKEEGFIKIKKSNMSKVLELLSNYFEDGCQLRWCNGFNIEDMEESEDCYNEVLTLEDVWEDLRYEITEDDSFYFISDFLGEKYGDDDTLFKIIAPFCEDSYMQFCGEDGEHFRFVIENGKFEEKCPKLIWE